MCLCVDLCVYVKLRHDRLLLPEANLINPDFISFQYQRIAHGLHVVDTFAQVLFSKQINFVTKLTKSENSLLDSVTGCGRLKFEG